MRIVGRNDPCPCGSGKKYKRCHQRENGVARMVLSDTDREDDLVDGEDIDESDLSVPRQYFGYDARRPPSASPFDLSTDGLVCMAFEVEDDDVKELRSKTGRSFKNGDWAVSSGAHEKTLIHGPFDTLDAAFKFGNDTFGVVRYLTGPESL